MLITYPKTFPTIGLITSTRGSKDKLMMHAMQPLNLNWNAFIHVNSCSTSKKKSAQLMSMSEYSPDGGKQNFNAFLGRFNAPTHLASQCAKTI